MYVWFGTPKSDQRSIAPHDIVKLFNLTDSICLSITLLVTLCYEVVGGPVCASRVPRVLLYPAT